MRTGAIVSSRRGIARHVPPEGCRTGGRVEPNRGSRHRRSHSFRGERQARLRCARRPEDASGFPDRSSAPFESTAAGVSLPRTRALVEPEGRARHARSLIVRDPSCHSARSSKGDSPRARRGLHDDRDKSALLRGRSRLLVECRDDRGRERKRRRNRVNSRREFFVRTRELL